MEDKRVTRRGASTDLYSTPTRATKGMKSAADTGAKLGNAIKEAPKRRAAWKELRNGSKKKPEKHSEKHVAANRARSMPQGPKKHSVHTLRGR